MLELEKNQESRAFGFLHSLKNGKENNNWSKSWSNAKHSLPLLLSFLILLPQHVKHHTHMHTHRYKHEYVHTYTTLSHKHLYIHAQGRVPSRKSWYWPTFCSFFSKTPPANMRSWWRFVYTRWHFSDCAHNALPADDKICFSYNNTNQK